MTTEPFDYTDMSPGNVRAAVALAAEAVRYANVATIEAGGLESPQDVDLTSSPP